jgi:hypothetical protein
MQFEGWTIFLGIISLFVGSYVLISAFTYLFLRFALKDRLKLEKAFGFEHCSFGLGSFNFGYLYSPHLTEL